MSAEERRHEGAPKKIDERVISEEHLSWRRTPESEESVALAHERVEDTGQRAEIPSGAAPERDETCDRLLCAISDTEIAKRMRDFMPADLYAPGYAEPPKTLFAADGAGPQPFAGAVQAAPATEPTCTSVPVAEKGQITGEGDLYINGPGLKLPDFARLMRGIKPPPPSEESLSAARTVQTSPVAASMPPMPSATPTPRHPAPAEPDSILEKDKKLCAIGEAGHLGGEFPVSNPQFRHFVQTSPQAASVPLMPSATAPPHRRASEIPRATEAATRDPVPQVPSPPQPVAVADLAPTITTPLRATPAQDRSPRTTIPARHDEINRRRVKLPPTAESMGRALRQISARLKNQIVAGATLISESTDFARLRRSTGLADCADATQGAPGMENMSQARPQPSTGLKKWFDPRRSSRLAQPPVLAYCWTADTPHPVKIADISSGGVYLLTEARWPHGGMLSMTLQRTDRTSETPESWIVIDFLVIRYCNDGVAGAFIPSSNGFSRAFPSRAENCADDKTLKRFVRDLVAPGNA